MPVFTLRQYVLAKVAYDAYSHHTGGKSLITGALLPEFDALSWPIKDAWAAAAIAVGVKVIGVTKKDAV